METLTIALLAALTVSAVSFIGVATFSLTGDRLKKVINLLLSLAAGAMLGNALLHMLPHALENAKQQPPAIVQVIQPKGAAVKTKVENHQGHNHAEHKHAEAHEENHSGAVGKPDHSGHAHDNSTLSIFALLLTGFLTLFALDLGLLTRTHKDNECVRPLGYLVMLSDGLENFLDGLVIGAAFLVSIPAGIATTIAIFLHEVPMELGDYAVMRHAGFSRKKALLLNFASAIVNVVGVILAFTLGSTLPWFTSIATPFAAGAILYLAATGILPQIRMQGNGKQKASYFAMTLLGVSLMALILLIE